MSATTAGSNAGKNALHKRKGNAKNTTKAAAINGSTTTSAAAAATTSLDHNGASERLQHYNGSFGDKLESLIRYNNVAQQEKQASGHRQQQQQQHQFNATAAAATTTTTTLYNSVGLRAFVNCCRDVNCHLNAPSVAAAALLLQQQTQQQRNRRSASAVAAVQPSQPAESIASDLTSGSDGGQTRAGSVAATTSSRVSRRSSGSRRNSESSDGGGVRDRSPDSGVGSDGVAIATTDGAAALLREGQVTVQLRIDLFSWLLFLLAAGTRFYKLSKPGHVVFDELHYGKYISYYIRGMFFFDQHPPLGKQLIAAAASFANYDGNFTFPSIGAEYTPNVPILWMRLLPAICGSLLAPAVYKLLLEARLQRWTALLGGLLVVFDNALLTQSRFVLMESILLLFSTAGLCFLLRFQRARFSSVSWVLYGLAAAACFACAMSVKYVGFFAGCLAAYLLCRHLWNLLYDAHISDFQIILHTCSRLLVFTLVPFAIYLSVFYVHLQTLQRAGPHDSAMTSAFQASLEGGLASITRSQPLQVAHGSQITLRHTHGTTCWLHSHPNVYPVRYPDKRGSSHQQQVTCYAFKDVNNWWIVKRPDRDDLIVDDNDADIIRDGDIIQLVHGITSRALNSHDVAAPMTPQCQEVSCYIDYEIKMAGELLWQVEILNKDTEGPIWHAIRSQVRLIHKTTGAALRFSGKHLPDWGFNQNEVVADRTVDNRDAIWNVEEHRYTKTKDKRERERQLLNAEMIPTSQTQLSFWEKFVELQAKMLWHTKHVTSHMYSSNPLEWPLLDKGIAYWYDRRTNAQIHLLGNVLIWYSGTIALVLYAAVGVFYLLRRHRLIYDLPSREWQRFVDAGDLFFVGYLLHYLPYFFVDRTLFLHHYLPALIFKLLLLCFMLEHIDYLLRRYCGSTRAWLVRLYRLAILCWLFAVVVVFVHFLPLTYGFSKLSPKDIARLRWKDTWDFIVQRNNVLN